MNGLRYSALCALLALIACARTAPPADTVGGSGQIVSDAVVPLECRAARTDDGSLRMPIEGRPSPFDSTDIRVGAQTIRVCYGRPGAKGRAIYGGLVPFGKLWRTGANEPTILHVPFNAQIAGLFVPTGSYSLYTVPTDTDWTIILNRSISQWGHESSYTPEVQALELGRAQVKTERLDQFVELFTIRGESTPSGADILLEWERTRVRIPVRLAPPS